MAQDEPKPENYSDVLLFITGFYFFCILGYTLYFYLSRNKKIKKIDSSLKNCLCSLCVSKSKKTEKIKAPKNNYKPLAILGLLWLIFAILSYKCSQIDSLTPQIDDPYSTLGIEKGSTEEEAKKAFKKLSLIHHPDRGGSEEGFMKLNDAYKILTDENKRENWERYGNPDGQKQATYGMALPIWLINEKTPPTIVGIYYLLCLGGIPGILYLIYRYSFVSKLSDEDFGLNTFIFYKHLKELKFVPFERLISVFSCSQLFLSQSAKSPENQNKNLPLINKIYGDLNISKDDKIAPFNRPEFIEVRAMIYSYIMRYKITTNELFIIQRKVVREFRGIILVMINEFFNMTKALNYESYVSTKTLPNHSKRVETLENCIKLCAGLAQALEPNQHPLFQLPYVSIESIHSFLQRKKNLKNMEEFVLLPPDKRQWLLNNISEDKIKDIYEIWNVMPSVDFFLKVDSKQDESSNFTVESLITLTILFKRKSLLSNLNETIEIEPEKIKDYSIKKRKKNAPKKKQLKVENEVEQHVEEVIDFLEVPAIKLNDPKSIQENKIYAHAPNFPKKICETWWLYVTYNNNEALCYLARLDGLYDDYKTFIQFQLPHLPGDYNFNVYLISDVYLGIKVNKTFKVSCIVPEEVTCTEECHHDEIDEMSIGELDWETISIKEQ